MLDMQDCWTSVATDANANGTYGNTSGQDETETRAHNGIDGYTYNDINQNRDYTYTSTGSLRKIKTTDPPDTTALTTRQYTSYAWNRLVEVERRHSGALLRPNKVSWFIWRQRNSFL